MKTILKFFDGKKSTIASLLGTLLAYFATKGWLGSDEILLIGSLSAIFFGTASYQTNKVLNKNKTVALSIENDEGTIR